MSSRRDQAYRTVDTVLREARPELADTLTALAGISTLRADLDAIERGVIDSARRSGASWTDIAATLGLRSRQAAEQRRLRLGSLDATSDPTSARARRRRQQNIDAFAGTVIIALRASAADLALALHRAPASPATQLASTTLHIASDADPGALVDLLRLVLADLTSTDLTSTDLDPDLKAIVARISTLLSDIDSSKGLHQGESPQS